VKDHFACSLEIEWQMKDKAHIYRQKKLRCVLFETLNYLFEFLTFASRCLSNSPVLRQK
jgi:hypothetical protein